jgi:hypothetical protein
MQAFLSNSSIVIFSAYLFHINKMMMVSYGKCGKIQHNFCLYQSAILDIFFLLYK